MARYKKRRYYKRSTNVIRMKFQSFMDIHTSVDDMQIISVSAGGREIINRLPAQFAAYKYYKIGNISVKLVPASTLPVDPTGLSYEEGETTVDPRDQLSPGLMRITNGEDVFEDLTGLTSTEQHYIYDSMQLDPRWYKWMLQRGVKRHGVPRYWQIGQLHQDKWPGATINVPQAAANESGVVGVPTDTTTRTLLGSTTSAGSGAGLTNAWLQGSSSAQGIFQVGHRGTLGWLPTDGRQFGTPMLASPPEVEVFKIILPPAYKTEYYYRMYISETVYFKEPVVQAIGTDYFGGYRPLDVFHSIPVPYPADPDTVVSSIVTDSMTGGNYGDN